MKNIRIISIISIILTVAVSAIVLSCSVEGELDPSSSGGLWAQKWDPKSNTNFGGEARKYAVGFSIGNKGYVGTGEHKNGFFHTFYEYNHEDNSWTSKASFAPGTGDNAQRAYAVGFSIGNKGYIGTGMGDNNSLYSDFWEYDPVSNVWTQKANFGGGKRVGAVGFSIGSNGYIGTGKDDTETFKSDFWKYDPTLNSWEQKKNIQGDGRTGAVGFSIGNRGYIGTGSNSSTALFFDDFCEYDPNEDTWTPMKTFPGGKRDGAVGFSIKNKGYIGTGKGSKGELYNDFWEFDGTWKQKADFAGDGREGAVGFYIKVRIGEREKVKGYIGTGGKGKSFLDDFWEFTPGIEENEPED
jgi:N-acetylneuraminic acid mutarotase